MTASRINGVQTFAPGHKLTRGYRPNPLGRFHWGTNHGWFDLRDLEAIRADPQVKMGLRILRAPIYRAKREVTCDSPTAKEFIEKTLNTIWQQDLFKILKMLDWGQLGGEVIYKVENGLMKYDELQDIHNEDVQPLQLQGKLAGVRVKQVNSQGGGGVIDLLPPKSLWLVNEPQGAGFFGESRLVGALEPWMEKRGKHGAIDVRRGWFVKNVYRGGYFRYPEGSTAMEDGTQKNNEDIAREIVEKAETGHVMPLPSTVDPGTGKYLWDLIDPAINGEPDSLMEYPKELDKEILIGMGIPPEIITAAETGSGWSGRQIPMLMFLTSEDQIVYTIIQAIKRQIIDHLVMHNFGPVAYEIVAKSLIEDMPEQQQAAQWQTGQQGQQSSGGWNPQGGGSTPPVQLGMVSIDEYHGPTAPSEGSWVLAGKGPRGGKIWRRTGKEAQARAHAQASDGWLSKEEADRHSQSGDTPFVVKNKSGQRIGWAFDENFAMAQAKAHGGSYEDEDTRKVTTGLPKGKPPTQEPNRGWLSPAEAEKDRKHGDTPFAVKDKAGKTIGFAFDEKFAEAESKRIGGSYDFVNSKLPIAQPVARTEQHTPGQEQPNSKSAGKLSQLVSRAKTTLQTAKAKIGKVTAFLDAKSNVPVVQQAKAGIKVALGAVAKVQGRLSEFMTQRYGKTASRAIFLAAQVTGANPAIFPVWFVALPGSTLLAQAPLVALAEFGLQATRAAKVAKKAVGLSEGDEGDEDDFDLSQEDFDKAVKEVQEEVYNNFFAALKSCKAELAEALHGFEEKEQPEASLSLEDGWVTVPDSILGEVAMWRQP